jgi:hypothetical protein
MFSPVSSGYATLASQAMPLRLDGQEAAHHMPTFRGLR